MVEMLVELKYSLMKTSSPNSEGSWSWHPRSTLGMDIGPQRVSELWFDDANIIFQAEGSLFRVHRSILQARSSVFHDMFSMPQTTNPSDLMDGCIFIHLPDAAEDLRCFFLAIGYDASFFEPPPTDTPLSVILAIARLSHKYDVPFLRRRALSHLSMRCPTTLVAFLKSAENECTLPPIGLELEVVKTALEIDASWVLPYQFLNIYFRDFHDLLAAQKWNDLEDEIQNMCLVNWRELEISTRHRIARLFHTLQEGLCMKCTTWSLKLLKKAVHSLSCIRPSLFMMDGYLAPLIQEYCPACRVKSAAAITEARESFWDSLPATFNLPPWATLQTKKSQDMGVIL